MEEMKNKGIAGSTLKLIAIITMFIDHTGAVVLERMMSKYWMDAKKSGALSTGEVWKQHQALFTTDMILRAIGRLGFPLFCFLLVEGFHYTRSRKKYAIRLFLFALVSEIPYDLAFNKQIFYLKDQNVFFTLFLGMAAMIGMHEFEKRLEGKKIVTLLLSAVVTVVCAAAYFLKSDYDSWGVVTIAIMYQLRERKVLEMFGGCLALTIMSFGEITSFITMIPVKLYNGTRGLRLKYVLSVLSGTSACFIFSRYLNWLWQFCILKYVYYSDTCLYVILGDRCWLDVRERRKMIFLLSIECTILSFMNKRL